MPPSHGMRIGAHSKHRPELVQGKLPSGLGRKLNSDQLSQEVFPQAIDLGHEYKMRQNL